MSLIYFLIVGLIAGVIASYVMGRQQDLLVNLLIGVVGAVVGGFLAGLLGIGAYGLLGRDRHCDLGRDPLHLHLDQNALSSSLSLRLRSPILPRVRIGAA